MTKLCGADLRIMVSGSLTCCDLAICRFSDISRYTTAATDPRAGGSPDQPALP